MKNKILLFSFIFILLIFTLINNSFAYSVPSITNTSITFFMPDSVKEQILTIEDNIPEFKDDNYYYLISTSFYNGFTRLIFFPKDKIDYIYGNIKNNDSIWAVTNAPGTCIVYNFSHKSTDINNHILELNLNFNKFTKDYSKFSSYSPDDVIFTYNSNDKFMWCIGNIPFYVEASGTTLWLEPVDDFFFKAPVTEQPEEELTLAEIMKTAGEQATMEMGQIILIVIATTAGLIILLIGLKKGLKVLMNGFRH